LESYAIDDEHDDAGHDLAVEKSCVNVENEMMSLCQKYHTERITYSTSSRGSYIWCMACPFKKGREFEAAALKGEKFTKSRAAHGFMPHFGVNFSREKCEQNIQAHVACKSHISNKSNRGILQFFLKSIISCESFVKPGLACLCWGYRPVDNIMSYQLV